MGKRQRDKQRSAGQEAENGASEEKRHKHDGEYPPAPVLESEAFESFYKGCGVVNSDEWEGFIATLRDPLGVSFRITGHPDDPSSIALRDYMEKHHLSQLLNLEVDGKPITPPYPISWYGNRMAWRFDVSRSLLRGKGALKHSESTAATRLAAFHNFLMAETELGTISRQEVRSAATPLQPLRRTLPALLSERAHGAAAHWRAARLRGAALRHATAREGLLQAWGRAWVRRER